MSYKVWLTGDVNKYLGVADTEEGANKLLLDYLKSVGFKSYYFRCWFTEQGTKTIDFGSHVTFAKVEYVED